MGVEELGRFHMLVDRLLLTGSHSKSENILSVIFDMSYFIIIMSTFRNKLIKIKNFLHHINVENYNEAGQT